MTGEVLYIHESQRAEHVAMLDSWNTIDETHDSASHG